MTSRTKFSWAKIKAAAILKVTEALAKDPHYQELEKSYYDLLETVNNDSYSEEKSKANSDKQRLDRHRWADAGSDMRNYIREQMTKYGVADNDGIFVIKALEGSFPSSNSETVTDRWFEARRTRTPSQEPSPSPRR